MPRCSSERGSAGHPVRAVLPRPGGSMLSWFRQVRRPSPMKRRNLGGTGISVSEFALGAMNFGAMGNADHDESVRIIHTALDAGINLIDTADVYSFGESEVIVGKALRGRRDDVVLATKFGLPMNEGLDQRGASPRWIRRAVEASLDRLNTDHI